MDYFNAVIDALVLVVVMMNFPEIGYTPANLRYVLEQMGWTQKELAERLNVSLRGVQAWVADVDKPAHRDMPVSQWQALLVLIQAA